MSSSANTVGWLSRLKAGLGKSANQLSHGISTITSQSRLDEAALRRLQEVMITADLGLATATKLTASLAKSKFEQEVSDTLLRELLAASIADILAPVAHPLRLNLDNQPHVVITVGVNGTGKTTTIAKLAHHFRNQGCKVLLAAADTFRAAAIDQLCLWGDRVGVRVIAGETGSDPAAVAFEALQEAQNGDTDLLMIDTAGRLHNKADLMAEIQKMVRVLRKLDPTAPHDCLLVLDATTGQNAHVQVETFKAMAEVTGLVVTKLDGSARGGVVVALAERFNLPIVAIGVGETEEDLRPFSAQEFANNLMGLAS